ncbi:MAG: MlaD family protein [Chitinophagaceae bacterium]|jgi:phospholipid/cholesterol/gamma-HCH transport system substrate-binding protein|nr:MlaD family protein [Chitinophagaceae bacterium]
MPAQRKNIVQLGIFVISGLALLLLALFLIGKNQHLIGSHYTLRAHFENVSGLRTGNNVRYAGIEVGTVQEMTIVSDTVLEVRMLIKRNMKEVIRQNALASLGADGLMGNKVINIIPQPGDAEYAKDGDLLPSRKAVDFDDILRTLSGTSENIGTISEGLKLTVTRINNSQGLWKLLADSSLDISLRKTAHNLQTATSNAEIMTRDIRYMVADVKAGKGNAGILLRDSAMSLSLQQTIEQLDEVVRNANKLAKDLDKITENIDHEIQQGDGSVNLVLKDTALAGNISRSLQNVEKGTASFNENMEAMKHNWLFKGYFKKQEKQKAKQQPPKSSQ